MANSSPSLRRSAFASAPTHCACSLRRHHDRSDLRFTAPLPGARGQLAGVATPLRRAALSGHANVAHSIGTHPPCRHVRTIVHLSDLHFGTEDPVLAAAVARDLQASPPSLLVVSGDFTQRARRRQFAAARAYLTQLPSPQLVIPGNHDVPLYDVIRRFAAPLNRFRRYISRDLDPVYRDTEIIVAGLNTARSRTWKSGRISPAQLARLRATFGPADERFKVVVTHHPFIPPPGSEADGRIDLVGGANAALTVLDECGVDLLLAGHLHHGYAGDTRTHYPHSRRSIISAQAGTAISRRIRTEPNAYNFLTLERTHIVIEIRTWNGTAFAPTAVTHYDLHDDAWIAR
ncbi:metallophosphoesterase [Horticoccus luteus]|uniref:Metallophosphoesterase n=1 Tax=Horticoccus luteus TaxID=2862869 RepID=A0A8F9TSA2_9BACT|nr:metallophosphoesterase [Horticoccus luteus]QYM78105.1 metallophosphoesterase [Horticoccus luteus]